MFWVSMGSTEFGGEIFGSYDTPLQASQAVGRLALEAFNQRDGIDRCYSIIEADSREEAENQGF